MRGSRKASPDPKPQTDSESAQEDVAPAAKGVLIGGASWLEVGPDTVLGVGFYRFRRSAIPDLDALRGGSGVGNVVELFAVSLNDAQKLLGQAVAKSSRSKEWEPIRIRPTHYRATRQSKKHRNKIPTA